MSGTVSGQALLITCYHPLILLVSFCILSVCVLNENTIISSSLSISCLEFKCLCMLTYHFIVKLWMAGHIGTPMQNRLTNIIPLTVYIIIIWMGYLCSMSIAFMSMLHSVSSYSSTQTVLLYAPNYQ